MAAISALQCCARAPLCAGAEPDIWGHGGRGYRLFHLPSHFGIAGIDCGHFAVALPGGIRAAVFMVAAALLAFGAADIIEETFAMRARRRRSDAIIGGPKAQRWRAVLRLAAGLTCLMLSVVGFMIWASVTTEM